MKAAPAPTCSLSLPHTHTLTQTDIHSQDVVVAASGGTWLWDDSTSNSLGPQTCCRCCCINLCLTSSELSATPTNTHTRTHTYVGTSGHFPSQHLAGEINCHAVLNSLRGVWAIFAQALLFPHTHKHVYIYMYMCACVCVCGLAFLSSNFIFASWVFVVVSPTSFSAACRST